MIMGWFGYEVGERAAGKEVCVQQENDLQPRGGGGGGGEALSREDLWGRQAHSPHRCAAGLKAKGVGGQAR